MMDKTTLYGLTKKDVFKVWTIWTEEDVLYIEHGQEHGKLQIKTEQIKGKNLGRSNETSPAVQAEQEARSRIQKQVDKGYRFVKEDLQELPLLPMLASDYTKVGHRVNYPCWVSPKMDGVRCIAKWEGGNVVLISRGGKYYDIPHLQADLRAKLDVDMILDGEIYIMGKYLEEITSAVKKPNALTPELEYVVFDIIDERPFSERVQQTIFLEDEGFKVIEYWVVSDEEEMKKCHKEEVAKGYEGIMLRNMDGLYESGKRSAGLFKYKEFFDDEFLILDVVEDRNGNAVFVVQNKFADNTFSVTFGDFEQRKRFLEDKEGLIGKYITVKYQTLYKDTNIVQFPTGVAIRDYDG